MGDEEITCFKDAVTELKLLPEETPIDCDTPGIKYIQSGHGFRFKKGEKKQKTFGLKIIGKEVYIGHSVYTVECSDNCGLTALLLYSNDLSEDKRYKVPGYYALDKSNRLIIIAGKNYSKFEKRLMGFASSASSILIKQPY